MMDEKTVKDKDTSESSLSESWNIVDGNDVNNISEGSDGESIEVIEEEAGINAVGKDTDDQKEKTESEEEHSSKSEEENAFISSSGLQYDEPPPEENLTNRRTVGADFATIWNTFNVIGLVSLICAIIFTGATAWVFLMKVEEIALDTFHYLVPGCHQDGGRAIEYNELMTQLKMYEAEAKNLRSVVTDLSGAVENLKKELAFSLKFADKNGPSTATKKEENNRVPSEEDILFQELLNIHIEKYHNGTIFYNEMNSSYGHVAVFIQEMIFNFTSGKERENNMEAVKLFYQIPRHLSVLYNFNSTNKHIELFINAWKSKLSFVNEKIVDDMRAMQLKMVRQFVKHMKYTQKRFYNKLCNLNGMKKQECYDTFVKPYEQSDAYSNVSEDTLDPNIQLSGSEEPDINNLLKDDPVNVTNRSEEIAMNNESSEWKTGKKIINKANSKKPVSVNNNGNENYYKENPKRPKEEESPDNKNKKKLPDRKTFPKQERPVKDSNKRYENTIKEKARCKGMKQAVNERPLKTEKRGPKKQQKVDCQKGKRF
ncbi:uncharacterized protein [Halyomorpha halys]|uniref:uncharacterized protein isoform X2 n=1 Tax=Halyomorpha halys TaxID=286706 RepID=UPI0006D52723|nr:MATH and LRR domain-containing protein PFE0570w-like isoform X2 [Halyomorpha halys]